jgi:hypothetical protein
MCRLIDKNGWEYYEKIPENYRLATIDDFVTNNRLKIGMEFLIQWALTREDYYQVCIVSERLRSRWLIPFIEENRVFVKVVI